MAVDRMRDAFHEMIASRVGPQLVFFVGAGISRSDPSNLPTFKELSKQIIETATGRILNEEECETFGNIRPEVILQILTEELGQKALQSLEALTRGEPNSNHFFLAEALEQGNWVFTTNYDNLIERACEIRKVNIRKVYEDTDFQAFASECKDSGETPKGCIFKLHGFVDENEKDEARFRPILIALRQVGRGLTSPKREVLEYFLRNFDFCFMGYSCQDDFSVYPVFLGTSTQKSIFWFKYANEEIGEITWSKNRFQDEKEREENKTPEEHKNWETINTSECLLRRQVSLKLIGDSSRFVKERLCPHPVCESIEHTGHEGENGEHPPVQWGKEISLFQRNLVAGRLYQYLEKFEKAREFFERAEDATETKKDKAVAKRWIANAHYLSETMQDYEKATKILEEASRSFTELGDEFEVAQTKIDMANNLRRRENLPEALKHGEAAKELLESKKEEFVNKCGKEKYELEYARCLNILGLVYYGISRKDKSKALLFLEEARHLCENSEEMRKGNGDIAAAAQSENAVGLICIEYSKYANELDQERVVGMLGRGINHLKEALEKGERTGDPRICEQCCRNLMLAYLRLAEFIQNDEEKKGCLRESRNAYEKGIGYMKRLLVLPQRRLLEFRFRAGELYQQIGEAGNAIEVLNEVVLERKRVKDWHNEARATDKLRGILERIGDEQECKNCCLKIMAIYKDVLSNNEKLEEMKGFPDKFNNAKDILGNTKNSLVKLGLISESNEIDSILERLTELRETA